MPRYEGPTPNAQQQTDWIAQQQARLDRGQPLSGQGIPAGYTIDNGRIVPTSQWEQWGKGAAIGLATGIAGGYGAGALNSALAAPTVASSVAPSVSAATGGGSAAATATGAQVASTSAGWFSPTNIIPAGVQTVASIFGAKSQADASREAAELQYKATQEALADAREQRKYEQAQYANYLGRLQPYLSLGTNSASTLQNLLGRSPYTKLANNGPVPQYSQSPRPTPAVAPPPMAQAAPMAAPPPQGPPPMNTGGVKLQAPDGSVKMISDPAQVAHYKQLGATVVA
jgi:hypothetical protein